MRPRSFFSTEDNRRAAHHRLVATSENFRTLVHILDLIFEMCPRVRSESGARCPIWSFNRHLPRIELRRILPRPPGGTASAHRLDHPVLHRHEIDDHGPLPSGRGDVEVTPIATELSVDVTVDVSSMSRTVHEITE